MNTNYWLLSWIQVALADPSAITQIQIGLAGWAWVEPCDSRKPLEKILKYLILSFNFFTWPYTAHPNENSGSATGHPLKMEDFVFLNIEREVFY